MGKVKVLWTWLRVCEKWQTSPQDMALGQLKGDEEALRM